MRNYQPRSKKGKIQRGRWDIGLHLPQVTLSFGSDGVQDWREQNLGPDGSKAVGKGSRRSRLINPRPSGDCKERCHRTEQCRRVEKPPSSCLLGLQPQFPSPRWSTIPERMDLISSGPRPGVPPGAWTKQMHVLSGEVLFIPGLREQSQRVFKDNEHQTIKKSPTTQRTKWKLKQ